ncbi:MULTISPECIES: polyhydroxyalkanoic acid system family protein [unclassified Sphingomonas]|uniref:polyhydroxyalkanoic acid system family protein n=1 Tax=unclassified Sphingomonas TaxID=196159 RepID=UPI0006F25503|nr:MULTISPECIES: polyhydroxyalkanoic acid system family protein [unclassified Sphingomonas]KQM61336.1 hypothetical protein ASE65_07275 [Sphingomonas sp. Leaf16]KQN12431.1 hypothetical protein ASE81_08285 [Sphingomonas sp. Leaf29]KQN18912.1 hypothetical protein ASE83_08210 [Sphingomonas sp. Leaf32]
MTQPVEVDIPHQLGREGVRQRIDGGIDKLANMIPGGVMHDKRWDGDTLHFTVSGMGQTIKARCEMHDAHVHAVLDLPPVLAMFANKIKEKLGRDGPALLK